MKSCKMGHALALVASVAFAGATAATELLATVPNALAVSAIAQDPFPYPTDSVLIGAYFGSITSVAEGDPIASISGDALLLSGPWRDGDSGEIIFSSGTQFDNFVAYLTNGANDVLWGGAFGVTTTDLVSSLPIIVLGLIDQTSVGDLQGALITSVNLVVTNVSITNDNTGCLQEGGTCIQGYSWEGQWEIYGEAVPAPATLALFGFGLAAIPLADRRRRLRRKF